MRKHISLLLVVTLFGIELKAQLFDKKKSFTVADTLRGSITPERAWWDVTHYDLTVHFDPDGKTLVGSNTLSYAILEPASLMQIDLMQPLLVDSIVQDGAQLTWKRQGDLFYVHLKKEQVTGNNEKLTVYYHGIPRVAKLPPWDGGVIWEKDDDGFPWISVACQGLGASVWYPNKDHQYDEPDSASMHIITDADQTGVSNGRLQHRAINNDGTITWSWAVANPINNYNLIPYIGNYDHFSMVYDGEKGPLDVDLWFLTPHLEKARSHVLPDVIRTLEAFEYWFGPFPFYEDSYKMVEAPHLGMEHQSAIAYGNGFRKGYLGMDLSGTGEGKDWDYIVVHESGHEWFGNNITTKDIADMWVHEGITDYSETLFVEYWYGMESADRYLQGIRKNISNDAPIIGQYQVNSEGSGDMYPKGANLMHLIRQIIDNDSLFRQILRGMNSDFYHQTVTSRQVEDYISEASGIDFSKVFTQYLRTTRIPVFEYRILTDKSGIILEYRWANIVKGFDMPLDIKFSDKLVRIYPTSDWQHLEISENIHEKNGIIPDPNYYIQSRLTGK